jgi:outer membrane immunogenic protein
MRTYLAAALLAATVATPALAQGEAVPTFTGGHIEPIVGVDRLRANGSGKTGVTYGIAGGYDFQSPSGTVFGIEGEVADASTKDCINGAVVATDRLCAKAKRDLYAGGRIGFTSGSTLIYGKAGYTNLRVGASYDDGTAATAPDFSNSRNLDGVRVGAGLEKRVGSLSLKAEYRYSNYQDGVSRHQGVIGAGIRF